MFPKMVFLKKGLSSWRCLLPVMVCGCFFSLTVSADRDNSSFTEVVEVTVDSGQKSDTPAVVHTPSQDWEAVKVFRVIPLRSITFSEAAAALEPFLSESGRLFNFQSRNSIMLYETPETIELVQKILEQIDAPPVNIRVSVTFEEISEERQAGIGAESGGIVISRERGGNVEIESDVFLRGGVETSRRTGGSTQFLLTENDQPARIRVGESVARPVWIYQHGIRRGWWRRGIEYQQIGASLWIHPRVTGEDQITIEVYPKLTLRGDDPLSVEVREAGTVVTVRDGQVVQLGGLDQSQQELYRNLFGIGSVFNGQRLTISLRADLMKIQ